MKFKILFFLLSSLVITGCILPKRPLEMKLPKTASETVNATYPRQNPAQGVVRLRESQTIFLKDHKMNITFTKVTQDHRCPLDSPCIKAGNVSIELELMGIFTRPRKFIVSSEKGQNAFFFNGKKISLEKIYPQPSTEMGIEELQGQYVADLRIEITKQ